MEHPTHAVWLCDAGHERGEGDGWDEGDEDSGDDIGDVLGEYEVASEAALRTVV